MCKGLPLFIPKGSTIHILYWYGSCFISGFVADVVYSGEAATYTKPLPVKTYTKPAPVPVNNYSKPAPPPTYTYKKAAPSTITYTKSAAPSVTYTKATPSKVTLALITAFIARFWITTFTVFFYKPN